jgi:hypothetical protein
LIAISSLTAISHLHFSKPCYGDKGTSLTALTDLALGDEAAAKTEYEEYNMDLSDQGARALGSLICLTHLDICGVDINDEGVKALSSLSALTD